MKKIKIYTNNSLVTSNLNLPSNISSLIVGNITSNNFYSSLEFPLDSKFKNLNIIKSELKIFVIDVSIFKRSESLMLNVSRTLDSLNSFNPTISNFPDVFQYSNFSNILTSHKNNYIKIDISKFLKDALKFPIDTFGLTLISLSQNSTMKICNTTNKAFLELTIDDSKTSNSTLNTKVNSQNRNLNIMHECSSSNSKSPSNINDFISQKSSDIIGEKFNYTNFNIQSPLNKSKGATLISDNDINVLSTKRDKLSAFGNFINTNGLLSYFNDYSYVKFDSSNNTLRTKLNITNDGIIISLKGIYKVDFLINCRADLTNTVKLELDENSIFNSTIQISPNESVTSNSSIINVLKDNMILRLKISTSNVMIVNEAICANLNIIKIN